MTGDTDDDADDAERPPDDDGAGGDADDVEAAPPSNGAGTDSGDDGGDGDGADSGGDGSDGDATDDSARSDDTKGSQSGDGPGDDAGGGPADDGDGSGGDDGDGDDDDDGVDRAHVRAVAEQLRETQETLAATRGELDDLEERVDDRTVHRDDVRAELRRYVRARQRRGHATGWGPYLVILYGTAMTLGAFYYLGGPWAIAAMLVVWLSTLGLYVFMVVVGAFVGVGRKFGRVRDLVSRFR